MAISRTWTEQEWKLHCNQKEKLAILYVLWDHCQLLSQSTVLIQCYNKTSGLPSERGRNKVVPFAESVVSMYQILDNYLIQLKMFHISGRWHDGRAFWRADLKSIKIVDSRGNEIRNIYMTSMHMDYLWVVWVFGIFEVVVQYAKHIT